MLIGPDGDLPRHTFIHLQSGKVIPTLAAGSGIAEFLIHQLARRTERTGSEPGKPAARDPNNRFETVRYLRLVDPQGTIPTHCHKDKFRITSLFANMR